jgi:phage tail-like protein
MADRPTDPYANYNFVIQIDGINVAWFREVSGLDSKIEVIDYREGGEQFFPVRKLPGKVTYSNIVLKVGVTDATDLYDWHKAWVQGVSSAQRKNVTIYLRGRTGDQAVRSWKIRQAWPANWIGPTFNAEAHEVAIQTLELAHEGIDLES